MFVTPENLRPQRARGVFRGSRMRNLRSCERVAAMTAMAALAAGLLAGCAPGAEAPSAEASALPAGVTVQLTQLRSDVASRQIEVRVTNGSDESLSIGAVSVVDERFSEPAVRVIDRSSTLAPGGVADIRVQLAAATCDTSEGEDTTVTMAYETNGEAGTATVAAPEVFPFLAALHTRECVAERVGAAVDVRFGAFDPSAAGEPAALELEITPRTDASGITLVAIRETNLLTFEGLENGQYRLDVGLGLDLEAMSAQTITLPLLPARCDPHAVQEDKRGTVFSLRVEIDGDEGSFDLIADPDLRGRLLSWVAQWCGYS